MRCLFDTYLLLWAAGNPARLPGPARAMIEDPETDPLFSVASIWEIAIKTAQGRPDFQVDARHFRHALLHAGYGELPISGAHAVAIDTLPPIHNDPFDRLLVAQAIIEDIRLITADPVVGLYPGPVTLFR